MLILAGGAEPYVWESKKCQSGFCTIRNKPIKVFHTVENSRSVLHVDVVYGRVHPNRQPSMIIRETHDETRTQPAAEVGVEIVMIVS